MPKSIIIILLALPTYIVWSHLYKWFLAPLLKGVNRFMVKNMKISQETAHYLMFLFIPFLLLILLCVVVASTSGRRF